MELDNIPVVVVPDTHGHLRQLEKLIQALRKGGYLTNRRLVLLGDYFDRGPEIKNLVEFCINLQDEGHILLTGNHEYVLTRALLNKADQQYWLRLWATKYELSTLRSYGVKHYKGATWDDEANELKAKMPQRHLDFLSSLPWLYESDNHVIIHAGVDPTIAWKTQSISLTKRVHPPERGPDQLFSYEMATDRRGIGQKQVITGHACRQRPYITQKRVMLDCGVGPTGILVAWISDTNQLLAVK